MAVHSPSRTHRPSATRTAANPTSGPGRGPASDGRSSRRHRRTPVRHQRRVSAEMLRLRAQTLFGGPGEELGRASPGPPRDTPAPVGTGAVPAPEPVGGDAEERPPPGRVGTGGDAGPTWRARATLAMRERLPLWLQTRCGLERRSVVALVVVLVAAAIFAGQHFWTGRTRPVRPPEVVHAAPPEPAAPADPTEPSPASASTGPTATAPPIVVDISGKVRQPGIRRLPPGSRVADALQAAGGVRPGTDLAGLNRARLLVDGEQVVVGAPPGTGPGTQTGAGPGPAGAASTSGTSGTGAAAATGPVALSTATAEQLDALPGVGPVLAQHIIDYRTEHGGFRSVDQLREVDGIGDRRFTDLKDLVRP
ncbi:helix-hairpin-helix domain-containing protein [Streptomyces sp. NPDC002004]